MFKHQGISNAGLVFAVFFTASLIAQSPKNEWVFDTGPIDPAKPYFGETVANGILGLMPASRPFQIEHVFLSGAYDQYETYAAPDGHHDLTPRLIENLNPVHLEVRIDDTSIENPEQVRNFRQRLDMKRAALTTYFEFDEKAEVSYTVRALRNLPYVALLEVTIQARQPIELKVIDLPTGPPELKHRQTVVYNGLDPFPFKVVTATASSPYEKLSLAASSTFVFDKPFDPSQSAQEIQPVTEQLAQDGGEALTLSRTLEPGQSYHFAVAGALLSSAHDPDPLNASRRLTGIAKLRGIQSLIKEHEEAWNTLWQSDVLIEGDDAMQGRIHNILYHLYSFVREGTSYSVPPMGLSGLGYNGHIFWDAETWMLPGLLLLHPEMAESMLNYRYQRLEAAKSYAIENGYKGAMFPLESADSGFEDTPIWASSMGAQEQHTTADVANAAWAYYCVTRDRSWLREKGYPILKETADFWASRVTRNSPKRYNMTLIGSVDEGEDIVENDAYTNADAKENLLNAIAAAKALGFEPNPGWSEVAANIPILHYPDGLVQEHSTYEESRGIAATIDLLAYPLHAITDRSAISRHLAALRKDDAPPGMTFPIVATLHARLGEPDKAYAVMSSAIASIERPPFNTLSESFDTVNTGYFSTAAGGFLQTMLNGFGGLDITPSGVVQLPTHLPRPWKSLTITGMGMAKKTIVVK